MNIELMLDSAPQILAGLPQTLKLVGSSLLIGFALAVPVALARLSPRRWLSRLSYAYVYVFRSTPLLVQIFLIYYGSGQFRPELQQWGLWGLFREPYFCAILALALNTGAYTSEVIRGGIQSVSLGEIEAGRALGMSRWSLFSRIIFPIAIRQALPAYGNEVILMVKASSLASTITILEITGIAKKIIAASFAPIEIFIIAGGIYLLINFTVTRAVALTERWLSPHRFRNASRHARPTATGLGQTESR